MKLSITTKTSIAGLVVLVMLLLVSFLSYQHGFEEDKAGRWIVHTHQVLYALEKLHRAVAENDAALRGFAITRAEAFLESYRAAKVEIKEREVELITLVKDNRQQSQRMHQLMNLLDGKFRFSSELAETGQISPQAAQKLVSAGGGERVTNAIKAVIEEMETEEKHLLSLRNEDMSLAKRETLVSQSVLIACSLALLALAYVFVRRHVSETDRSQETLQSSKLRFTGIFQQAFQFIWILSTEGNLLQANQTALDFVDMHRESEVGKPFWETAWWLDQKDSQETLRHGLQDVNTGNLVRMELGTTTRDGKPVELDFSFKPLLDENGKVTLIIAEGRDISEFKTTQARLHENQVRLNAIFSSMGEGLYQLNEKGALIYLNPAGARILGYENVGYHRREYAQFDPPRCAGFQSQHPRKLPDLEGYSRRHDDTGGRGLL